MNRRRRYGSLFVMAALLLSTAASVVLAGTTGKIVGKVTDAKTGEGLPGANVMIVGTRLGAATDLDGSYVIINVSVGTYSVQATMIGFKAVTATGVRSIQDLTTRQDFKLEMGVIDLKHPVIISGTRPLIEPTATATTRITSSKEIERSTVKGAQDVVSVTAGAVGSGNNIYIRGGRRDEVSYFVDGLSINDPVVGGAGLNVNKLAIQEVMVQTGGFSAEYGDALSGMVNIVTKEGGDKFSGLMRVTTNQGLGGVARNQNLWESSLGGTAPGLQNLRFYFSGELGLQDDHRPMFTLDHSVSQNGQMITTSKIWERVPIPRRADGWVDRSQLTQFANDQQLFKAGSEAPWIWADTTMKSADDSAAVQGGWWSTPGGRLDSLTAQGAHDGWKLADKKWFPLSGQESYRMQGKMTYAFNKNMRLVFGANGSRDQWNAIDETGDWSTNKYRLDQFYSQIRKGFQGNVTWKHTLGKRSYYSVNLNHFETLFFTGVRDLAREDLVYGKNGRRWWNDYKLFSDADSNGDGVYDDYAGRTTEQSDDNPYGVAGIFNGSNGLQRVWSHRFDMYNGVKVDYTNQLGSPPKQGHELRTGAELKIYRIDRKYNSLPWDQNAFRDEYVKRKPIQGAAYLLDKMEFEGLVVNAGLRMDYLDPNSYFLRDYFSQDTLRSNRDTVKAGKRFKLSPRLGISHPVSERTVLHFNFGQFFQQPQLQYLYESVASNINNPPWITRGNQILGNPDLEPQTTIQYEAGFSQQFSQDVAGDVTVYYKDIYNYVSTVRYYGVDNPNLEVDLYTNLDYGNARGFELTLQKRPGEAGIVSGKLSYSVSIAKGSASYPGENYQNTYYGYPSEKTTYPLDFDQRHTTSADLNFGFNETFGPKVGNNHVLSNLNVNFLNTVGSGLPYWPTDQRGVRNPYKNSGRKPWTFNTDMLATKDLKLLGLVAQVALEVDNLFNRKNVNSVYASSGDPLTDGKTFALSQFSKIDAYFPDGSRNPNYNRLRDLNGDGTVSQQEAYQSYVNAYRDRFADPTNLSAPRTVHLRFGIRW